MDVTGEAGRNDATTLIAMEQVVEHGAHRSFRCRVSVLLSISAVGEKETNAFGGSNCANSSEVSKTAVDRGQIELEIASVKNDALRRMKHRCDAVGNRVRHWNKFDVERPDHAAFAIDDRDELGAIEQSCFFDAVSGKAERER